MSKFISTLKPGEVFLYPLVTYDYVIEGVVIKQDMTTDGMPFSHWDYLDQISKRPEQIATGYTEVATFNEFKDIINKAFYDSQRC